MEKDDIEWVKARDAALSRDNRRCRICNNSNNLHVHHIIPRHLGGTNDAGNLVTLCAACHASRHPTLQFSLSQSFIYKWALRLIRLLDFDNEIPDDIEKAIAVLQLLGKSKFREGQLEIVLAALRQESILVVRPTGSGKSLCYQVPCLMSKGTAYVFTPLKALMVDQTVALHQNMIPATFINSDITQAEKEMRMKCFEDKTLKFLFLTPERFDASKIKDQSEIERLTRLRPSYLVIDEAHCIDRWGNDFRPSYGRLAEVRAQLQNPPVLAFTATAGLKAQKRIVQSLGIPNAKVFVSDVDRPNIALIRYRPRYYEERFKIIAKLIAQNAGKTMIFVPTVKTGNEVAMNMAVRGIKIPFYHSRLPAVEREFMLGQFTGRLKPAIDNIICTNAFGMGIDIPNVYLVIHWAQPESVEDYLQEYGRAGRDGKPSIALIFHYDNDVNLRLFMADKTTQASYKQESDAQRAYGAKSASIHELHNMITNNRGCFRKQIVEYFKESKKVNLKSLAMRILEWLMCIKTKQRKSHICCDVCNAKEVKQLLKTDRY